MKINKIKILGGNQQFADEIINHSDVLSEVDRKFINLIHENTESDEERRELIKSLETIKTEETTENDKKKSGTVLKKFLDSSTEEAGKQIIKNLIEKGSDYLEYLT